MEPIYAPDESFPPPELFPKRMCWVMRQDDSSRVLDIMRWGVPLTMKGPKGPVTKPVTNVRNLTSPFWKSTIGKADFRCLVPVTDFCEWEGETGAKHGRWFSVPSRPIFAFAGVWRPSETGKSFAFLTCEPNELVRPIHAKAMPVILHDEEFDGWLSADYASVCDLASPYPTQLMQVV